MGFIVGHSYQMGGIGIHKVIEVAPDGRGYIEKFPPRTPAGFSPYTWQDSFIDVALGKPPERFEVGKWYQYVGPKERGSGWNAEGFMDWALDGKPHQCTDFHGYGPEIGRFLAWYWGDTMQYIREVSDPREPVMDAGQGHNHTMPTGDSGVLVYPYRISSDTVYGIPRAGTCALPLSYCPLTEERQRARARLLARI